jgi:Xaa-Pro aminopeptidase
MKGMVTRMPAVVQEVADIKSDHRAARDLLEGYTTQWGGDRRLLPNMFIGDFTGEFDLILRRHNDKVARFVGNADRYIAESQVDLGSYTIAPPTKEEIASSFSLSFDLAPVPDVGSYSTNDQKLQKMLQERFEADIRASFQEAQKDLMQRLAKPLENLIDRMAAYEERQELKAKDITVGKSGTFKATVVSNVTDIAKIFDAFNMTKDPLLMEISRRLHAFDDIEHEDLVRSKQLRDVTAAKAAEIRSMLGDWLD